MEDKKENVKEELENKKISEKEKKDNIENTESKEDKEYLNVKKLKDVLLTIIAVITLGCGAIIYYSIYKYSDSEILNNANNTENISTIADMINTAMDPNSNVVQNNTVQTSNSTVTTEDADSRKVLNQEIIVLYDGLILEAKEMGLTKLKYIDNSNPDKDDYVVTYYNYEHYKFQESGLGTLSSQVLDGLVKIDNVGKIAISEKYEAIPREIQVVNSLPTVVAENNSEFKNYDSIKTIIVDLDGDAKNEYIVILANKTSGTSKIVLVEATGFIKSTLATMSKSGWETVVADGYYLSYNNVEIIDIDNDGIMEILIEMPTRDVVPSEISVLKYKNGDLSGKTDIGCTLVK